MNGDWYPWDGPHNGGEIAGAENYLKAWKYIYRLAKQIGPEKIKLVWCPNNISQPETPWNQMEKYFPGDEYIDWIGLDGYNWGYSRTQSFADIFGPAYRLLTRLSRKPLMIGEFACAEDAAAGEQSKAAWLNAAFTSLESDFPAIKLFNWFNINKERDWRVESSPAAIRSFRNMLQKGYFLDKI
jgi:beta-mannanase